MRALDVVGNDLQVGLDVRSGARHQQKRTAQLLRISLLRSLLDTDIPIEDASPTGRVHDDLVQLVGRVLGLGLQAEDLLQQR